MCQITAITSGKGGSGKTMVASNMACTLAMAGNRVLLIDMNTGLRNLDICLGMENQVIFDLSDVITGICLVKQALIRDRRFPALYLLSASQNCSKATIKPSHIKKICKHLGEKFNHIIIDTPAGLGEDWQASVACADNAVIVMTQEYVSVRDADTMDMKLREMGVNNRYAVVNKVNGEFATSGLFPTLTEISEALRLRIIGVIQEDLNVHIAMNKGIPVVCKKDSYVGKNFVKICEKIFA